MQLKANIIQAQELFLFCFIPRGICSFSPGCLFRRAIGLESRIQATFTHNLFSYHPFHTFFANYSVFILPPWPSIPRSALSIRELKMSSGRRCAPTPLNHVMKKNSWSGGGGGYCHKFLVYCRSGSRSAAPWGGTAWQGRIDSVKV